jgi:two-component system OmpR family sensor kinase
LTLRARLTLWYTTVLAGVLLVFGASVYFLLSSSLTRQIEDTLQTTADNILKASRIQIGGVPLAAIQLELDLTANIFVQVLDDQGVILRQTMNFPARNTPFDEKALSAEVPTFTTVKVDGARLRVLTVPLRTDDGTRVQAILQLAASLATADNARETLVFLLIGGGLVAIIVAGMVGWATARTALRPIEEITQSALTITQADDLAERIPFSGPANDEVGKLVQAFNETLERLEKLFETQKRFLADVSHELRTPLTTIRGNVDLLRRMGKIDMVSLDAIRAEVDRMTRMVQDLMLLVQAESGKLPLAEEVVELDTLLLEVFHQAKVLSNGKIGIHIGREDQARILGDRDRLKQVLLNLVANALEHTPKGGDITLALSCVAGYARLTVTDTGTGIPKEELPHIFERFYRTDPSRKRKDYGGAGLGLSIAYWIVRSHKGKIEVASEVGKGTTFSVWLPLFEGESNGAEKRLYVEQ